MKKKPLTRIHPDYHLPADVDAGRGFDGVEYVKRLKDAGADAAVFFAKCHYGHAYYPTTVGTVHPRLQCDMLQEVIDGCREHGLYFSAYLSVFLDTAAAEQHPDWRIISESSRHGAGFDSGNFKAVCVNSPYTTELFLPQTAEVASKYDVDEMFYDTMSRFQPCYCTHCREKFGKDIPKGEDDPSWGEYVQWYKKCFDDFFAETARVVHEARPGADCSFNWKWGIREPSTPPPHITNLLSDLIATGNFATRNCRYYAGTGYPFDYMTGRFLHGLSEWDNNTDASLLYTASTTVAHGGGFYLIDRQMPDGSLEQRGYDMMNTVFGFINERRATLEGITHVPEIAVLYSERSLFGPQLEDFPRSDVRESKMRSNEGIVNMLSEHGVHYTVVSEETFRKHADAYTMLMIPEQNDLEPETETALRAFAEAGGTVIVSQTSDHGEPSPQMLEFAGVSYEGRFDRAYGYTGTAQPFHTRVVFSKIKPQAGTSVVYPCVEPLTAGDGGKKFGHGLAPPGEVSQYAAVTARSIGSGNVLFIAYPAFQSYAHRQSPYLRNMILELISRYAPWRIAFAETDAKVELVTCRKDRDLVLNLVNHSGKEKLGDWFYPVTEYMPVIRDVKVHVRGNLASARLVPADTALEGAAAGERTVFTIPDLHFMQTLVIRNYFD